ncbi:MAG TPA: hypothetical protein VFP61_12525 [Acidimicrobiales bacterium]|nr:hypothetical protein [Acidimicrobiales bacterium]
MSTRVTVCAPADLDDGHWRRWSSFEELRWPFPSPFTARDFVEAVARARPDTRVAVIEADGEVVGYLPHQAPRRGVATAVAHGVSD